MKRRMAILIASLSIMMVPTLAHAETITPPNVTPSSALRVPFTPNSGTFIGHEENLQNVNPMIEDRRLERKNQGLGYLASSLDDRLNELIEAFDLQIEKHAEIKKEIVKSNDLTRILEIENQIRLDGKKTKYDMKRVSGLFSEIKVKPAEERENYINQSKKILTSIKESRSTGVEVYDKIITKKQTLQIGQRASLMNMAHLSLQSGDEDKALEAYAKITAMQHGDTDSLIEIAKIVDGKQKSYVFFNHELVHLDNDLVIRNGKWMLRVSEIGKMNGLTYQEDDYFKTYVVESEDHVVLMKDDELTLDGVTVGMPLLFYQEDNERYVDFEMMLGLFGYDMRIIEGINLMYITKPLYERMELDTMSVDQMLSLTI